MSGLSLATGEPLEEALEVTLSLCSDGVATNECVVEYVLDRSPPGDLGVSSPPAVDADVKRVEAKTDSSFIIKNMPSGQRFLVRGIAVLASGRMVRTDWIRARTYPRTEAREDAMDFGGIIHGSCEACPCESFRVNVATTRRDLRCRGCGCSAATHRVINVAAGLRSDISVQIEEALQEAVEWVSRTDAVLVVSGQGMSIDSHADFAALGANAASLAGREIFLEDPRLAWGSWLQYYTKFKIRPHEGYDIVRSWTRAMPVQSFVYTSNLNGHWTESGWLDERIFEHHGAARWLQCAVPCCGDVWPTPDDMNLMENLTTGCTDGVLPVCRTCGNVARPCIKTSGSHEGFSDMVWRSQSDAYNRFWQQALASSAHAPNGCMRPVVLELGCGADAAIRDELEPFVKYDVQLVRVDPNVSAVGRSLDGRLVSVPLGVIEALQRMDALFSGLAFANFIILDYDNNGAEFKARRDTCASHLLHKAYCALGGRARTMDSEELEFVVEHVHSYERKVVSSTDTIPENMFFVRCGDRSQAVPVVKLWVSGVHFHGRNAQLEARVDSVRSLITDLNNAFGAPEYQVKLACAPDRTTVTNLIKSVHVQVLPSHGFAMGGLDSHLHYKHVMQMQGFLQSGYLTPDLASAGQVSLQLSGIDHMKSLPPVLRVKGAPQKPSPSKPEFTCIILLRHGQREDYLARGEGYGAEWVMTAKEPWDPSLACVGRDQALAASRRLRSVLLVQGLPAPSLVFTSPFRRCIETGAILAQDFGTGLMLVEEGLSEAICEAWMRQWAVPGADATWGGPREAAMTEEAMHQYSTIVQGPPVTSGLLRAEAEAGVETLVRPASKIAAAGMRVQPNHKSHIHIRGKGYHWNNFETRPSAMERIVATLRARARENPGKTLVFVTHGGPNKWAFDSLVEGKQTASYGGMTSLSVLRCKKGVEAKGSFEALLAMDALHAEALHKGVHV